MKIFLSYSHLDKNLAGKIKKGLHQYGVNAFLAHHDIEPSEEWADRILKELRNCDVFMPILTKHFNHSKWTDQETGCALILKKLILPLKVDIDPQGFISRYQAHSLNMDDVAKSLRVVMKALSKRPRIGNLVRNALIEVFASSDSFESAKQNTELLLSFKEFNMDQVKKIIQHTINNDQIYRCFKAQKLLRNFVDEYKDKLNPRLYRKLQEMIEQSQASRRRSP
jgi:hypothetical protein